MNKLSPIDRDEALERFPLYLEAAIRLARPLATLDAQLAVPMACVVVARP